MAPLIELYRTDHAALVAWIVKTYGLVGNTMQYENEHRVRREVMSRRLRLYRDQAFTDVKRVIGQVYDTEEYRQILYRYIPVALEQNVTRRIVDEVASLYDKPALRVLKTGSADAFRAEEKRLHLHEVMQEAHHLLTLCNEVLVWQFTGANDEKKLRLVTPDMFDAIPHPRDGLVEAALVVDAKPVTILTGDALNRLPHFEIWDDTYRYLVNAYGHLVDESGVVVAEPLRHDQRRIPAVLMHRREPSTCILDSSHGADIESAHLGVALLNVMIMRLSKAQGENQPILQGNLANMATGQIRDGERPLVLPPEVVASMLNMKTDPDHYLSVKKDKLTSVAQSYGMSYEQYSMSEGADTASGKVYAMRREKLTEIRLESRRRAVVHEAQIVKLIGFVPDGMRVDYQEQAIPSDAVEEISLLRDKMKMGLDSPIDFLMRKDTDLSRDEAQARILSNMRDYAMVIMLVRALNVPADGDAENPGKTPQENGADNQPADAQQSKPQPQPFVS